MFWPDKACKQTSCHCYSIPPRGAFTLLSQCIQTRPCANPSISLWKQSFKNLFVPKEFQESGFKV